MRSLFHAALLLLVALGVAFPVPTWQYPAVAGTSSAAEVAAVAAANEEVDGEKQHRSSLPILVSKLLKPSAALSRRNELSHAARAENNDES